MPLKNHMLMYLHDKSLEQQAPDYDILVTLVKQTTIHL